MSNHNSIQRYIPKAVALRPQPPELLQSTHTTDPRLLVTGQGTITFTLAGAPKAARLTFLTKDEKSRFPPFYIRYRYSDHLSR